MPTSLGPSSTCCWTHTTTKPGTPTARLGRLLRSVVVTSFQTVRCPCRATWGSQQWYSTMCVGRAAASLYTTSWSCFTFGPTYSRTKQTNTKTTSQLSEKSQGSAGCSPFSTWELVARNLIGPYDDMADIAMRSAGQAIAGRWRPSVGQGNIPPGPSSDINASEHNRGKQASMSQMNGWVTITRV